MKEYQARIWSYKDEVISKKQYIMTIMSYFDIRIHIGKIYYGYTLSICAINCHRNFLTTRHDGSIGVS